MKGTLQEDRVHRGKRPASKSIRRRFGRYRPEERGSVDPEQQVAAGNEAATDVDRELDYQDRHLERQAGKDRTPVPTEAERVRRGSEIDLPSRMSIEELRKQIELGNAEIELLRAKEERVRASSDLARAERDQARAEDRRTTAASSGSVRASVRRAVRSSKARIGTAIVLATGALAGGSAAVSDPEHLVAYGGPAAAMGLAACLLGLGPRLYRLYRRFNLADRREVNRTNVTKKMTETYNNVDYDFKQDRFRGWGRHTDNPKQ